MSQWQESLAWPFLYMALVLRTPQVLLVELHLGCVSALSWTCVVGM